MKKFFLNLSVLGKGFLLVACWAVIAVGVVSCGSGTDGGGKAKRVVVPVLDFDEALANVEDVKLSEFATSVRYIPLETNVESFVGGPSVSDFYVKDGAGFFFRATFQEKIGVRFFSPDGEFIRPIGVKGRAKGEFMFNTVVVPSSDRDEIAIGGPQGLVVYTLGNEYVKNISFDLLSKYNPFVVGYSYIGNGKYDAVAGLRMNVKDGEENLVVPVFGEDGNIERVFPVMVEGTHEYKMGNGPDAGVVMKMVSLGLRHNFGGKSCYLRAGIENEDTLYMFGEDYKLIPFMVFDYGRYTSAREQGVYPNYLMVGNTSFGHGKIRQINDSYLFPISVPAIDFPDWKESTNDLCVSAVLYTPHKYQVRTLSYDGRTGMTGFVNDIDGGIPFYPDVIEGNKMYQLIDAISFIDLAAMSNSPKMKAVAKKLGEESNPVIIEVTLKD